jgi:hypothetical protein
VNFSALRRSDSVPAASPTIVPRDEWLRIARDVVVHEATTLGGLVGRLGAPCVEAIELILGCRGDVIVTGMGKAGLIGAKLAARGWLHWAASRLANGRKNGPYVARITAPGAEDEFRSWLERHGARVYRSGGLPPPQWNVRIPLNGRRYALVDSLFEPFNVISELDGPRFHDPPEQARKDKARDRELAIRGTWCCGSTTGTSSRHPTWSPHRSEKPSTTGGLSAEPE